MKRIFHTAFALIFFPAVVQAQFLFEDATSASGISMQSTGASLAGAGVVVFDLNGDGWDDIYMPEDWIAISYL